MITAEKLFSEQIILENERAKLTPLQKDDFTQLDKVAYDPQIWQLGMNNLE